VVTCADDPGAGPDRGAAASGKTVYTYGESEGRRPADHGDRLDRERRALPGVARRAGHLGEIKLALAGPAHVAQQLGRGSSPRCGWACRLDKITEALASFPGVRRRFERKGIGRRVRV
jgi:UDP-N-acetylmuramate--alanine ligase